MRGLAALTLAVAALAAAGAAPAARRLPDQKRALAAVRHALAAGQIDRATAARDTAEINRAARLIHRLPSGRREHVAEALAQVAAFSRRLTRPRAVTLIGQLKANDDYFARHWAPPGHTDITDADGVVYRYFSGRCFEFHPLAEFVMLNALVSIKDAGRAARLAEALLARGVHQSGGLGWEYYFSFGGGRPPWLSGMAQAMAAQALVRAAALLPEDEAALLRGARGAYRTIPGRLVTSLPAGPWIRLYAFDSTPVLNAQLQAVVSLRAYAVRTEDAAAARLAAGLQEAAATLLPRFDTGYWTYYALPDDPSPLLYQDYVVQLLTQLAPADPRFAEAAARFGAYRRQPPAYKLTESALGELRFWLSKPATVSAYSAAGPTKWLRLGAGWHTFAWSEPARQGIYPIRVNAVDWAGNRSSFEALPIIRVAGRASALARRPTAAASPVSRPALQVGAGLDDPVQAARAHRLGLRLVRMQLDWPSIPVPDSVFAAAFQPLSGSSVLIDLRTTTLPSDDVKRAELAQYAAALAQLVPGLQDLVLTPAPAVATAPTYAAALAAVRDAVHSVLPDVRVGPAVDGGADPKATLAALGRELAPLGRMAVVAFHPAAAEAQGAWTADEVPQLVSAFERWFGETAPPVLIDGLATPTTIPAAEAGAYPSGQQPAPGAVPAKEQGKAYAEAITAAACSMNVAGVIVDRLLDSALTPAPPTGLVYAGGGAKPSASLVAAAAAPAQRGTVVCPGLASPAAASTLEFPTELDATQPASVVLACARDCLYLIMLEDARGRPLVARRGALRGARPGPLKLELPKLDDRARYRLDVRLVDRINPGAVTRRTSGPLTVIRP